MEAIFGVITIALLIWMLIWMTSQAKSLKAEIEGNITSTISQGEAVAWNTSQILPDHKFPGLLLKTFFGYRDRLYLVQVIAYLGFLLTIGSLYFRSLGVIIVRAKSELKQ